MLYFSFPFLRERFIFFSISTIGFLGIILCWIQTHTPATCMHKAIEIKCRKLYNNNDYTTDDTLILSINNIQNKYPVFWILPKHRYATGADIIQYFHQPGTQDIHVFTGTCHYFRRAIIRPAIIQTKDTSSLYPAIIGPGNVAVGIAVTFSSNLPMDVNFSWQLAGKEDSIHHSSTVTYTFHTPGEKILTLIINRDTARMAVKQIHIFPPPILSSTPPPAITAPPPIPRLPVKRAEPAVPSITEEEFKFMLQQVINGNKLFTDFSEYLCNNVQIPVIINEKNMIPFNQFCIQIKGRKRLFIEHVDITRDKSGCISTLSISYNKKKFIGLF